MCVGILAAYMSVHCTICEMPKETRRGCWISWVCRCQYLLCQAVWTSSLQNRKLTETLFNKGPAWGV